MDGGDVAGKYRESKPGGVKSHYIYVLIFPYNIYEKTIDRILTKGPLLMKRLLRT
jgi:hypothetical protein